METVWAKSNTVHLTITMAFLRSKPWAMIAPPGRMGNLLILRLTLRGLCRLRLETTRSARISSSTVR